MRKLLTRLEPDGDAVVVHGLRGRASNRKLPLATQKQALAILQQPDWHDFGPTFAAQQLAKLHQIQVGKETLRGWMMAAGIWKPGQRKITEVHAWRPRRSGFGEFVPWDTSEHDWLEGRGPVRYLVRMIDDATSWSWGRFVVRDATPTQSPRLWATSPGATPKRLCEHTMWACQEPCIPELSTWPRHDAKYPIPFVPGVGYDGSTFFRTKGIYDEILSCRALSELAA